MSAQPIDRRDPMGAATADPPFLFAPMELSDIGEVAAIERAVYAAPWSEGNFVDSLSAGYCAWTLKAPGKPVPTLVGYFVLMAAVDEAHLLNMSVAARWQAHGNGLYLLRKAAAIAADYKASSIILEVRPSNVRALAVYRRFGFREHGLRRRYYPVSGDDQQGREDAIVMRLPL